MPNRSRAGEAAQRFAERRRREDEAPRLQSEVPALAKLRLEIEERGAGAAVADTRHVRHVVVERAPALFLVPCGDPSCRDGGHDLTRAVLRSLADGAPQFTGEDACYGTVGTANCGRVVRFVAFATYK